MGFPGGSVVKNRSANARDMSSIPELGGSPGGGNGNPLQYSCLENSMDRGAWQATVHGVAKSQTWLSTQESTQLQILLFPFFSPDLNEKLMRGKNTTELP